MPVHHRSSTTSPRGRQQQISAPPFAGGSSGSGSYSTSPAISAVSQVWQTPVRQDHRTGTSHASASSSRLWYLAFQGNVSPLRAKETCGPNPAGSAGKCGEYVPAFIPGVMASSVPNISVWIHGVSPLIAAFIPSFGTPILERDPSSGGCFLGWVLAALAVAVQSIAGDRGYWTRSGVSGSDGTFPARGLTLRRPKM